MQSFVDLLSRILEPGRVTIIRNGQRNTLERDGLIQWLRQQLKIEADDCKTVSSRSPSFTTIVADEPELLVYPQGDKNIPAYVQAGLAGDSFQHTRILAFLTSPIAELVKNRDWQKPFMERVSREITWPRWDERKEDREDLINEMLRRITVPPGKRFPTKLHPRALQLLLSAEVAGTEDIDELLKKACNQYLHNGQGPMLGQELFADIPPPSRRSESRSDPPTD
jgi:hypothetical protein